MGEDFLKEAEKVASNKYVWAGVAVAALVGGYFWISSQLANVANSGATDTSGSLPSTVDYSPLSAVGATSGSSGDGGSSTIDPTTLLQMETQMNNNNLQLGLAQLQAQTTQAQLQAGVSMAGLQVEQNTSIASTLASAFQTMFGKKPSAVNNFNGAININGTPIDFSLNENSIAFGNISNPKSGLGAVTGLELGQNAGIVGQTYAGGGVTASGASPVPVSAGLAPASGVGSVVNGSRQNLA